MQKFRIHALGLPHTVSSKEFVACAYSQKVVKFCKMMTARGHHVIHYGHEDSKVECTEHVTVLRNEDFLKSYGTHNWRKEFFKFDTGDHAYQTFYKNAINEIAIRKQKNDFILPFWGSGVRPICDAHSDLIVVEPGIGYAGGHWARFKCFESYAIYHAYYGLESVGTCKQDWYDVVIPNYFDLDDFTFKEKKEDYFLFLGRVYEGKGIHIAIQVTERLGVKLKVAGQSNLQACGFKEIPKHVEFIGYADVDKRRELMSNAKGAFVASMYNEPFGGVQIECLLSGTPTITTDWGAFTENNIHGLTGYRCRSFNDFVWAAENIEKINPKNCRIFGENFSLEKVALLYEKYFTDVLNVHTNKGWYQEYDINLDDYARNIPHEPKRCNYTRIIHEETPQAESVAKWFKDFNVFDVFDIGCGPGIYTDAMNAIGVKAKGFDIDARNEGKENIIRKDFVTDCIPNGANGILCLEVAEHIPEENADAFVENVATTLNKGGLLVWSAAIPGQGGDGHINCQYKTYWKEKLGKYLAFNPYLTDNIVKEVSAHQHMGWFTQNVMVFRKT